MHLCAACLEPAFCFFAWNKKGNNRCKIRKNASIKAGDREKRHSLVCWCKFCSLSRLQDLTPSCHQTTCERNMCSCPSMLGASPYLEWGRCTRRCHTRITMIITNNITILSQFATIGILHLVAYQQWNQPHSLHHFPMRSKKCLQYGAKTDGHPTSSETHAQR